MSDDDGKKNPVFVWINNGLGGLDRQKWYRPFVGKGLKDHRIMRAYELTGAEAEMSLDQLSELYPWSS